MSYLHSKSQLKVKCQGQNTHPESYVCLLEVQIARLICYFHANITVYIRTVYFIKLHHNMYKCSSVFNICY